MTDLIACLSTGKGTWGHVSHLIKAEKWNKVFLITNEFGKENFQKDLNVEFIVVDSNKSLKELRDDIYQALNEKTSSTEVALNIISGIGKEHMAIISAVLRLGLGLRFVAITKDGMEEL
ncbi:hypothetical protein J4405_04855 [Candidatus Woesearchaeota archaeon]|nr:hypothetical protein [Candidatus Woesearchaeota archaeon]